MNRKQNHRKPMTALWVFFLLLLTACAGDETTGTKNLHTLNVQGMEREFIVYVPDLVKDMDNTPVVFMLHGTGGDGEKFFNISRWREKADEENFIAVFPSALVHCFRQDRNFDGDFSDPGEKRIESKWSGGDLDSSRLPLCTPAELAKLPAEIQALVDHVLADDMQFISKILDFLQNNYNVNRKRIYASGFSNGGVMTTRLSQEMSHRFAAIAAAAGQPSLPPQPVRPHSFIFSAGNEDDRFLSMFNLTQFSLGETLLTDVPELKAMVIDPMLTILQLDDIHTYADVDMFGMATSHFIFADSSVGESNSYTMIIIDGLGHQYPNGVNHPVVLVDYLWDFFKIRQLP